MLLNILEQHNPVFLVEATFLVQRYEMFLCRYETYDLLIVNRYETYDLLIVNRNETYDLLIDRHKKWHC